MALTARWVKPGNFDTNAREKGQVNGAAKETDYAPPD